MNTVRIILAFLIIGVFSFFAHAKDDLPIEILNSWENERDILVATSARKSIIREAKTAIDRIENDEMLASAYSEKDLKRSLGEYLDNQIYFAESPALISILVEEISPGGTVASFPGRYPSVKLSSDFEMDVIVINLESIFFDEPKRTAHLLLDIGDNNIQVSGGSSSINCEFNINAERGHIYDLQCP